jgi:tetratricopeptide (TPR) repeat protein
LFAVVRAKARISTLFLTGLRFALWLCMNAACELPLPPETSPGDSEAAIAYLALGQTAEANGQWEMALEHFGTGLSLSSKDPETEYLLFSNASQCLNALGLFYPAERYCRLAIAMDPKRHHAYLNLGISLHGQGNPRGAAWSWVEAMKASPPDQKAAALLRQLLAEQPTLLLQCPWIQPDTLASLGHGL